MPVPVRARVATHVHSDWSYDGSWTLPAIARAFRRLGYDAVLLAEHDRDFDESRWCSYQETCARASTETLVLVPGIEYSDPANTVHVPVWGEVPFLGEGLETAELLHRVQSVGGLAVLAHLSRRGVVKRFTPEWLPYLLGVELWNRKYDGYAPNRFAADLLREHPELLAVASLDFHTARHFHPLAMILQLDQGLSAQGVIDAIGHRRAHPTAYRLPAANFAHGPVWPVMSAVERGRKGGLVRARRVKASYNRRRRRLSGR